MATIEFRPLGATHILDVGQDLITVYQECIHMKVIAKLKPWETLALEDGTSMEGKTWNFSIFRKRKDQEQETEQEEIRQEAERIGDILLGVPIGEISYAEPVEDGRYSQPETFFVKIEVDDREFESLLTSVRNRKAMPRIFVNVSGLDFGLSPNGDDVIWRNKTSPTLQATSATFEWPLGKFETDDEQSDDDGGFGNTIPEDQSKIPLTVGALRQAADTINKSLRLVAWMIAGLIAAVIIF